MADWLDEAPVGDWLEADEIAAPKSAVPYEELRFACMRGSGRVWACDGQYVAYRPFNHALDKQSNPAFQERIEKFKRAGHFKHIGTFDEVEVYQLLDGSPWKAKTDEAYIAGKNLWKDIQHAAKLACDRDWVDYRDLLEAMAQGMIAGRDPEFARQQWEDAVAQIMVAVYQRQGPLPAEIKAGVENVQRARGYGSKGPSILMVSDVTQTKNVQREA